MTATHVKVRLADLQAESDARAVLEMTRAYAHDPMGGGKDLDEDVKARLLDEMRDHPAFFCFIAWDGDEPVGIASCLVSFSTLRAKKIANVHDLSVVPKMRGRGVSTMLLRAVEDHARNNGWAKLTLEVLARNHHARDVYHRFGFEGARATEDDAKLFCAKDLDDNG